MKLVSHTIPKMLIDDMAEDYWMYVERSSDAKYKSGVSRLNICKECDRYNNLMKICKECKCVMPLKVNFIKSRCPIGKW
tara:strand:+ start:105 stop:341 length:237 start_codon:yes stop_codon:yes gene_type:complete